MSGAFPDRANDTSSTGSALANPTRQTWPARFLLPSWATHGWPAISVICSIPSICSTGVIAEFVKEALVFTGEDSANSKLMFTIMGGMAEFERAMIRERQLEGIVRAKEAGKYRGRHIMTAAQVQTIRERAAAGERKAALGREFGVTRQTIYNLIAA
jgi:hypothetical protein